MVPIKEEVRQLLQQHGRQVTVEQVRVPQILSAVSHLKEEGYEVLMRSIVDYRSLHSYVFTIASRQGGNDLFLGGWISGLDKDWKVVKITPLQITDDDVVYHLRRLATILERNLRSEISTRAAIPIGLATLFAYLFICLRLAPPMSEVGPQTYTLGLLAIGAGAGVTVLTAAKMLGDLYGWLAMPHRPVMAKLQAIG